MKLNEAGIDSQGNPEGEKMVRSLNRENLWESHTPQAFKYSLLLKAYQSVRLVFYCNFYFKSDKTIYE